MPETSDRAAGKPGPYQCQACLGANKECDLGPLTTTMYQEFLPQSQPTQREKVRETDASDQQHYSTLPEMSPTQLAENHEHHSTQTVAAPSLPAVGGEVSFSPHSDSTPPQEGSEMLLVRLMDTQDKNEIGQPAKTTDRVLYFGDGSIWSDSLRRARSSKSRYPASPQPLSTRFTDSNNLHYAVPPTVRDQPQDIPQDDLDVQQEEIKLLRRKGAFSLPPPDIQRKLLDAYFTWLYPLQPILDKEQFLDDFDRGQAPIILLQALLFAATTCCDESIIVQFWPSRRSAQSTLYKRVRALYDADYEQNRVTIVQVLFLMCFWWGSPMDKKDFSHWLAASIHLAQVTGMHRSTKDSHLSTKDRKLWKRIWWTLYVRDHFDAASVGRPMIINDDDCDVEPLCLTDFECDENETPPPGAMHCVEMTKLATLIGRAIRAVRAGQIHRDHPTGSKGAIDEDLSAWEKQLPEQLRYHEGERSPQAMLFAAMLMLGLHFCRIVLHRKGFLDSKHKNESISMAPASANAVTRIVEELLSEGLLPRAQVHLIAVIFASFTIHIVSMEQSQGARRRVLQHKSKLCLLGLAEFRDYWPFVDWMYRLFSSLLHWLEVGDSSSSSSSSFSSSEGHTQGLWTTTQLRPENTTLQAELTDSTPEVNHGDNNTAMSLPLSYEQDASSMAAVQPDHFGMLQQFTSGMLTSENFLDPFMPLDNLDWDDANMANLANLAGNPMLWTSTPLPTVEKGSLS
ncbi:Fungal specific transcription factor domain-containing protein [Cladophialophora immunda]|nr:Fungal specific transcription factor domain-containing protein [Cladophialophora immunda]